MTPLILGFQFARFLSPHYPPFLFLPTLANIEHVMNLQSHNNRHDHGLVEERRSPRTWFGAVLPALVLGTITTLAGCAHQQASSIYHSTVISYFPHHSALKPQVSTSSAVDPHAYGYRATQWHNWSDEWGAESETILDDKPVEQQPQDRVNEIIPLPAPGGHYEFKADS